MVKINDKELVYSKDFLVQNDQEVIIDAPVLNDILKLSVVFKSGAASDERNGSWTNEGDVVKFVFSGWNNPLGTCVLEPTKFGDINGKRIFFQLAHQYVAEINLAHLYIFIGD